MANSAGLPKGALVRNYPQGGKGMRNTIGIALALALACSVTACGTFNLGNVRPQVGRTAEQQQLDTLTCKDQANLAVNSTGRQTGDFLLGMTIVGAPVAYEMDKAKQRQVFADCMHARGYVVTAPDGSGPTPSAVNAAPAAPTPSVPGADKLIFTLPPGFETKPLPGNLRISGAIFFALNHTLDIGFAVTPVRHEGISDLMAFAQSRRANQADRLKDATYTDVTPLVVKGLAAVRYTVTGTFNSVKATFVVTLIDGRDEIVIVNAWAGASNAQLQMAVLESLADAVSGIG
jgi:hypothetical protein